MVLILVFEIEFKLYLSREDHVRDFSLVHSEWSIITMILFSEVLVEQVIRLLGFAIGCNYTLRDFVDFNMHDVWVPFFDDHIPGVSCS